MDAYDELRSTMLDEESVRTLKDILMVMTIFSEARSVVTER